MTAHSLAENVELESFVDLSKDIGVSEDFGVRESLVPTPVKARKLGKKAKSPRAKESLGDGAAPASSDTPPAPSAAAAAAAATGGSGKPEAVAVKPQPSSLTLERLENTGQMLLRQTRELLKTANKVLAKKPFLKGQRLG